MSLVVSKEQRDASAITKDEWREYTKTVWNIANTSDPEHPAVFPPEIPRRLIKMFSFVGETVLDPFAGTGTTGLVAAELNRYGLCVDQNEAYVERMLREKALLNGARNLFEPSLGDARFLDIEDNSIGLAITSPPYWNKADYGDGGTNLGNASGYLEFVESLRPAFAAVFRVLAPGRKFCVNTANVNQHTEHGLLTFPLASDLILLLRELGFVLVNEIIWNKDGTGGKWGSANGQRPIFGSYPYPPNLLFKNVHEYIIIAAKPPAKKSTGKTVLPYDDIMRVPSRDS
ncbi:site-specific DNA-methyltransferase [Mycolicibacterium sp. 120270]|uniref:site-specific DNA-methyltransferase n=1 Tax=Mycolicibacterium sp. 120270 TaxID=3090600 RepID=UPI00299D53C4|nr:site-specific DNA-methyltransferase [Mycolicibacterium sp. 120270]MDX1885368.1 site-specific DNA-methyltransferase [Mycolicibacterium sp. 120270]